MSVKYEISICSVKYLQYFTMICVCRHYLYEQKLEKLLWKIDYKDLMLVESVEDVVSQARPIKVFLSGENLVTLFCIEHLFIRAYLFQSLFNHDYMLIISVLEHL